MPLNLKLEDPTLLASDAFIGGGWHQAASGGRFPVSNPATGAIVAEVADLSGEEVRQAIAAAAQALPAWRGRLAKERSAILRTWHDLIVANADDLARILAAEQGKPFGEALKEIAYGATFIEWFAEEAKRIYGDVVPTHMPGRQILTVKEPVGVVAAITPWNFPNAMITRKVAPALAAGCTVVLKPSEETPLSALALAVLAVRAGVPAGVLNVVTGTHAAAIGAQLTGSPLVRKFTFTGSTRVGKLLLAQCASTVKKTSLELGGNAPLIVFDDANLDLAIEAALASKFRNAGQTCVCSNRILVQDTIYDEFADCLVRRVAQLQVGAAHDAGVEVGPLINRQAAQRVLRLIAGAIEEGASLAVGGTLHPAGANFITPAVLLDVDMGMEISREEIFGPVATLFRFRSEEEAIAMANATEYGLAAYFFTRNLARSMRVSAALEYGMVGINEGIISTEIAPFGGIKESGLGREGSKYGIEDYLEIKYILVGPGE
ncbi:MULTISPECIES: NAD-dependent succinate-semialdehyde dehydrogenase [unclassified Sphingomonas]|uniref:NAD-dependent succinate-semialdehyde dehydrogenase n=1 Tax=Novosphingobium rhizosphaerae TaxID=1551649 RepID=UPI0015C87069